jgi:hypothetical protein
MMFDRLIPMARAAMTVSLLGVSACQPTGQPTDNTSTIVQGENEDVLSGSANGASDITHDSAVDRPVLARRSCAVDIGAVAAANHVKMCRNVSPASHPPCNAENSCAMIEEEIARSCALFDGKGAPMAACQPAPKSKEAAAAGVQRYYSALNARDFDTAWDIWSGPAGQTRAKFEAGFAQTRSTRVTIGPLMPGDGGAGSIYQPVPVTVDATLLDGTKQRYVGNYVLRRVNDVDGAIADQLRWHIMSARLTETPVR